MPGFELFGEEEKKAVNDLFDANNGILFAHGFDGIRKNIYRVREFEKAFTERTGASYAQAVSSGSAALLCAIKAMGVEKGDEVVTQSFTFVATVEAIILAGAIPVIVDVDLTLNMDPEDLARKITPKTKLIIPVHMAGVAARMDEILSIAKQKNILVLEDAAQGVGAYYKGLPLGTIGDAGIYSLDFGKTITCGEGGMVITNNEEIFFEARCYHDHGHEYVKAYPRGLDPRHAPGFNFRMNEVQAAIGIAQLGKLDFIVERQKSNKCQLKEGLMKLPVSFRELPDPDGDSGDTCFFMVESSQKANEIVKAIGMNGLGTKNVPDAINWHFAGLWDHMIGQYYEKPLLKVFEKTKNILERTVALPVWVKTDTPWIDKYIETISACF